VKANKRNVSVTFPDAINPQRAVALELVQT